MFQVREKKVMDKNGGKKMSHWRATAEEEWTGELWCYWIYMNENRLHFSLKYQQINWNRYQCYIRQYIVYWRWGSAEKEEENERVSEGERERDNDRKKPIYSSYVLQKLKKKIQIYIYCARIARVIERERENTWMRVQVIKKWKREKEWNGMKSTIEIER